MKARVSYLRREVGLLPLRKELLDGWRRTAGNGLHGCKRLSEQTRGGSWVRSDVMTEGGEERSEGKRNERV